MKTDDWFRHIIAFWREKSRLGRNSISVPKSDIALSVILLPFGGKKPAGKKFYFGYATEIVISIAEAF